MGRVQQYLGVCSPSSVEGEKPSKGGINTPLFIFPASNRMNRQPKRMEPTDRPGGGGSLWYGKRHPEDDPLKLKPLLKVVNDLGLSPKEIEEAARLQKILDKDKRLSLKVVEEETARTATRDPI
ncbi:hypothetical protein L6452_05312 [Arctium lappa]|uniref:Uncharacterized protein n=1 Tax=Arctium lappa TaxID=4217 RepID=A0ACB9EFR6_ARCLA|nr:hypothetical protein L6452_05312 [Arctium lappa]